jgi:hypothetical protein
MDLLEEIRQFLRTFWASRGHSVFLVELGRF